MQNRHPSNIVTKYLYGNCNTLLLTCFATSTLYLIKQLLLFRKENFNWYNLMGKATLINFQLNLVHNFFPTFLNPIFLMNSFSCIKPFIFLKKNLMPGTIVDFLFPLESTYFFVPPLCPAICNTLFSATHWKKFLIIHLI